METVNNDFLFSWIFFSSVKDPRWWILFVSIFLPWIVWWKFVDKEKFFEILSYGFFWSTIATWLDLIGTAYGKWSYPVNLNEQIPTLLPADLSVIPVCYMLLYQMCLKWKVFLFGSAALSVLFSYIVEPAFSYFGMFHLIDWSHTKSALSFFLIAILTKALFDLLKKTAKKFLVD